MPIRGFQPSFAAGVLGPGLHGRVDLAKYDVALSEGVNIFIHTHGGFSNRPGFEFVAEVDDSTKFHRLIPFERDDQTNYVLVFGDATVEFVRNGAMVQSGGSDYSVVSPFAAADLPLLDYEQSADVLFLAHRGYAPRKLSRSGETSWAFSSLQLNPTNDAPTGLSITPSSPDGVLHAYAVTSVTADGKESFAAEVSEANSADLKQSGRTNSIGWTAAAGADTYNVYRARNGVYGYIGFTKDTVFGDDNISANLEQTPPESVSLFNSADNYPGKVAIYQQRLMLANSITEPESIWGSKTGDFENFTRGRVVQSSDRFEAALSGRSINSVKGLLSLRELLAFGAKGEFALTGPDDVMNATSPMVTQYGYTGSEDIKPLVVNDTALFVERTGNVVRDLRYAFESDGYTGNELTILAYHYFDGRRIVDWTYAQNPFSLVWAVLDDGSLLSLTYKREHQVWAWTEHDISAEVESIACIPEGGEDAVYIVAKKTINSVEKRYILRLHSRAFADVEDAFFVDFGLSYEGAATDTFAGLDHLEGEEVVCLGDGDVYTGLTVSGGSVTLPNEVETAHIGLAYQARATTLPPAIDLKGRGTSRGRPHNINRVDLQVENTRGIKAGPDSDHLTEYPQVKGPDLSAVIGTVTGLIHVTVDAKWSVDGGSVAVVQDHPLPMTVLAVAPDVSIGV